MRVQVAICTVMIHPPVFMLHDYLEKHSSACTLVLICVHVHEHAIYMYMYMCMYKFSTCFLTLSKSKFLSSQYCFLGSCLALNAQAFVSATISPLPWQQNNRLRYAFTRYKYRFVK